MTHTYSQQHEDDDDIEYNSERETRKRREPELVGALPPGALDWRPQVLDFRKLGMYYADLSKSRLTGEISIVYGGVCKCTTLLTLVLRHYLRNIHITLVFICNIYEGEWDVGTPTHIRSSYELNQ